MSSIRGLSETQQGERISEFFWRIEAPRWRDQGLNEDRILQLWVLFMRKGTVSTE
jgi:hypothetical protein